LKMKTYKKIIILLVIAALSYLYATQSWPEAIYDVNYDTSSTLPIMVNDNAASQDFSCPRNGLTGLRVRFATMSRASYGSYTWSVQDIASGAEVASGSIDPSAFSRSGDYKITFNEISDSAGHTYRFTAKANGVAEDQSLSLYVSNPIRNAGQVLYNGEAKTGCIMLKQTIHYFNVETFIVCIGLLLYLVVFIQYMNRLFH